MVLRSPSFVKTFVREYCQVRSKWIRRMLASLVVGVLVLRGRRTLANLADSVLDMRRDRSSLSRFFRMHVDDVVDGYGRSVRRAVNRALRRCRDQSQQRWLLLIDTTFQRKHALRMANLIQYKEKSKGVPAKNHGFVVGLLIAPDGTRIPLPVEDFLTRRFLKTVNRERRRRGESALPHRSQLDLAADLIRLARRLLPANVPILVAADNFFEGPKLDRCCQELGNVKYVTTLDGARVLRDDEGNSGRARSFEKSMPDRSFTTVPIRDGEEPYRSMRRDESKHQRGKPKQRTYRVARRRLAVNGLGERTVLFSWKRKRLKEDTGRAKAYLKILITDDDTLATAEIIDAYLMRWQIELFFRELKSDLGLGHYQVLTMDGIRCHVHVVLTAFLFLEMYRLDRIDHPLPRGGKSRVKIVSARTRQLVLCVQSQIREEEVTALARMATQPAKLIAWIARLVPPRRVA